VDTSGQEATQVLHELQTSGAPPQPNEM